MHYWIFRAAGTVSKINYSGYVQCNKGTRHLVWWCDWRMYLIGHWYRIVVSQDLMIRRNRSDRTFSALLHKEQLAHLPAPVCFILQWTENCITSLLCSWAVNCTKNSVCEYCESIQMLAFIENSSSIFLSSLASLFAAKLVSSFPFCHLYPGETVTAENIDFSIVSHFRIIE